MTVIAETGTQFSNLMVIALTYHTVFNMFVFYHENTQMVCLHEFAEKYIAGYRKCLLCVWVFLVNIFLLFPYMYMCLCNNAIFIYALVFTNASMRTLS